MNLKPISLMVALSLTSSAAVAAPFVTYDARSMGMGGLSVVTSTIDGAPFNNPAMLAASHREDDFSIMATAGGEFGDPDNLLGDLDAFTTHLANGQALLTTDPLAAPAEFIAAADALSNTAGKNLVATPGGGASVSMAGEKWSLAVSGISTANLQMNITNAAGGAPTVDLGTGAVDAQVNTTLLNTTDMGVSLARSFDLGAFEMAFGLTPKLQSISAGSSSQSLADPSASPDLMAVPASSVNTSGENMDAGVVIRLTENLKVGAVAKNLVPQSIDLGGTTLNLGTQLRGGVAYNSKTFTIGMDMDLIPNESITAGGFSTQLMAVGTEINAFDTVQLRAGMSTDLLSPGAKRLSLGAGVRVPYIGLNINLAASMDPANPNSMAALASFGLKF